MKLLTRIGTDGSNVCVKVARWPSNSTPLIAAPCGFFATGELHSSGSIVRYQIRIALRRGTTSTGRGTLTVLGRLA